MQPRHLLSLPLLALAALAQSPAKHAITHEDVWLMRRVGVPEPSPDGRRVVHAVTEPAYDQKEQASDLWLVSLVDDSPPRRLTFSKGTETGVHWSADGTKIVFAAKREGDEVAQLYVLPLDGGEAQRVTDLTLGARAGKWSPDGKRLLFVGDAFPGAADEEANKKAAKELKDKKHSARAYERFPPRFWDKWLDDRKPHLFVQEARAGAKARDLLAGTKLAALPGFGGAQGEEGQSLEAEWSPDGATVVFIAATNLDAAAHGTVPSQIFGVPADGGEPQRLTGDRCSYGQLAFAPDGKALLCTTRRNTPGAVYDLTRIARFPWPFRDEPTLLTDSLDRSVSRFAAPAGSDRIFFTCEHAGLEGLWSVAAAGGEARAEAAPATGTLGGLNAGGEALVATWDSAVSPAEVYALRPSPRRLTSINTERAAAIDWQPVEHFWFQAKDGRQVHNMIVKPAGFVPTGKYPLFTVIHGGAHSMWRDTFVLRWNYHLLAQPGYVVLLTDYKGSTGYGEEFARAIHLDPLKGPADEINEAADEAIRRYPFLDGSRQAAGGASYGGHLANWLQATTTRYKAIVSHAGEADLVMQWGTSDSIFNREVGSGTPIWGDSKVWREQSPALQAGNHAKGTGFVTPILITAGELDFRVPLNNALMCFALQQRLQVPSRLIVFPDENHWVMKGENSRYWYGEVHAWLARWLQ